MGYIEDEILALHEEFQSIPESKGFFTAAKAVKAAEASGVPIMIYFFIGARRMGKTDFFLALALRLYQRYGRQTMWVRNKLTEVDDRKFYIDFLNDAYHFGWISGDWKTDEAGVWDPDKNLVIKFQSLSTFSNRRGPGHPDVDMIFIDEFIPEDRKYPKNCVTGMLSLSMSVFAGREEARIFAASNPVSLANPYFATMEIYPSARDVTVFPDKGCLIERCKGYRKSITQDSAWNRVYKAGKYSGYIDDREDRLIELVCRQPKGVSPAPYALSIGGKFYRPYHARRFVFWRQEQQPDGKCEIYTPEITEVTASVMLIPPILKRDIEECVRSNQIRFDSPNTLYSVMSIIYTV